MNTKTIKSKSVTEDVLDGKFIAMESRIEQKFEQYSQDIVKDISDLFYEKLNALQNTQDKILGKFENWQTEETVGTEQIRELRVDVDDHEKRIAVLETTKN